MLRIIVSLVMLAASGAAWAQVQVKDAWARPALQGQDATGAFMTLTAVEGARLVGAGSPVAGIVEIHEMTLDNNVMKMRQVAGIDLPPGRAVQLAPGGYHVMLMDLKRPLAVGEKIPLDLRIEQRDKRLVTQRVEVQVAVRAPGAAPAK
jgi:copper(I)-binding protein